MTWYNIGKHFEHLQFSWKLCKHIISWVIKFLLQNTNRVFFSSSNKILPLLYLLSIVCLFFVKAFSFYIMYVYYSRWYIIHFMHVHVYGIWTPMHYNNTTWYNRDTHSVTVSFQNCFSRVYDFKRENCNTLRSRFEK